MEENVMRHRLLVKMVEGVNLKRLYDQPIGRSARLKFVYAAQPVHLTGPDPSTWGEAARSRVREATLQKEIQALRSERARGAVGSSGLEGPLVLRMPVVFLFGG